MHQGLQWPSGKSLSLINMTRAVLALPGTKSKICWSGPFQTAAQEADKVINGIGGEAVCRPRHSAPWRFGEVWICDWILAQSHLHGCSCRWACTGASLELGLGLENVALHNGCPCLLLGLPQPSLLSRVPPQSLAHCSAYWYCHYKDSFQVSWP